MSRSLHYSALLASFGLLGFSCVPAPGEPVEPGDDLAAPDDDDSALDDDDAGSTDDDDSSASLPFYGPAVYQPGQVHSPITPWVADRLWDVATSNTSLRDDVFMKVGASSTVSSSSLHCFAEDPLVLGAHLDLEEAIQWFRSGDAAGTSSFERESRAAEVGRTAGWAISGSPSPVQIESAALLPRLAIVHYGANDMGMGSSYASALPGFYENMMSLVEGLVAEGIIPVLLGITHRADLASAEMWVPSYNTVIRGIAQAWQVPFVDLLSATDELESWGLASDGLHPNRAPGGACLLTPEGLEYGYNLRNLLTLQALDRVRLTIVEGLEALDEAEEEAQGSGTLADPFPIPALPFTDSRDTRDAGLSQLDEYVGCDSTADESGPELVYRLELTEPTSLRALVLDRDDVDIDLHILDASATEEGCLARGHRRVEGTLPAGTWHIVLDSWVDDEGEPRSGPYLFTLQSCSTGDTDCANDLEERSRPR